MVGAEKFSVGTMEKVRLAARRLKARQVHRTYSSAKTVSNFGIVLHAENEGDLIHYDKIEDLDRTSIINELEMIFENNFDPTINQASENYNVDEFSDAKIFFLFHVINEMILELNSLTAHEDPI